MKSLFCILAMFSLALVSCTERLPEKEMPKRDNGNITMIKATVDPLQLKGDTGVGNYSWKNTHVIGIYGEDAGYNERYMPVQSTVEDGDNEAYFFGNVVGGDLTVYMPYSSEGSAVALAGRVTIPAVQQYYSNAFDHIMYNSTLCASSVDMTGTTPEVHFGFYAGLVKIEIKYDVQDITSISVAVGNIADEGYDNNVVGDISIDEDVENRLVNAKDRFVITGFPEGIDSSIENPLVVWAAMAPGVYENFVIEISDSEKTITAPVEGPFVVEERAIAEKVCVAEKIDHDNGVGGFEGENGEFNPKK